VVAIAVATIRMMMHFRKTSDEVNQLTREGREVIVQLRGVVQEAGEIVGAFREVAPRVRGMVSRFEEVGERTLGLSEALMREVEIPIRTAVAVVRGVRFGAQEFIGRLTDRFTGRTSTNGGSSYE
jgi:hypothetical protein